MKKNYNAPLVEAVSMIANQNVLETASPTGEQIGTSYEPGFSIPGN